MKIPSRTISIASASLLFVAVISVYGPQQAEAWYYPGPHYAPPVYQVPSFPYVPVPPVYAPVPRVIYLPPQPPIYYPQPPVYHPAPPQYPRPHPIWPPCSSYHPCYY